MKYRLISLAAAASLILSLVSCVSINLPKKDGAATESESESKYTPPPYDYDVVENNFIHEMNTYLNMLGSADYGAASVMIAAPSASPVTGDGLPAALSEETVLRNRSVEEKLNVVISAKSTTDDAAYTALWDAKYSGEFFADIIMIRQDEVARFASDGLLTNLKSLPFADFESGFNVKSGVKAAMANSTGYAVAGWATLDADSLPAVFFNKAAIAKADLEDPYELVKSGRWTWDRLFEYASATSGVAVDTPETLADRVLISTGERFTESGLGVTPRVALAVDGASRAAQIARRILDMSAGGADVFASGGASFLVGRLGEMKTLKNSEAVWGILPMPKSSEEQENYFSLVPSDNLVFAVPAGVTGPDKISRVISALNICSYGYHVDAYLTDAMNYYLRDNSSIEMVERICYSATWDMAYTAGPYDGDVASATYNAVRAAATGDDVAAYLDAYREGADFALSRLFP